MVPPDDLSDADLPIDWRGRYETSRRRAGLAETTDRPCRMFT